MSLKAPKFGASKNCRSEHAREKRPHNAIIQTGCVIVNVHREHARSYRDPPLGGYAISRNSRRRILPTGVIGSDSRNTMCLGTLYAVKFSLQ
ncbi:hypothetical protein PS918_04439 [Pseudomonas fluorescens]|uniref:Uncharacterized protein n=1 Tax=Pseudomonas fluorescens TaxID=294 RepID=A0A5E7TXM2_PSEFL|nr:hypothetical protein PS918_04439 [Pseudomonas fluorescens]